MTQSDDDKKRRDPYDPRTGATGNDSKSNEADSDDDVDDSEPRIERPGARSSPGSGEDEDEAAVLQPNEVENGGTAR